MAAPVVGTVALCLLVVQAPADVYAQHSAPAQEDPPRIRLHSDGVELEPEYVAFEPRRIDRVEDDCSRGRIGVMGSCAWLRFEFPEFTEAPTEAVLTALNRFAQAAIAWPEDDLDAHVDELFSDYRERRYGLEGEEYSVYERTHVMIAHEEPGVLISMIVQRDASRNGIIPTRPHITYTNLDLRDGERLDYGDLLVPGYEERLLEMVRADLLGWRNAAPGESLADVGFSTRNGDPLTLPENFLVEEEGLTLTYGNAISPYAWGPAVVRLSWERLGGLIRDDGPLTAHGSVVEINMPLCTCGKPFYELPEDAVTAAFGAAEAVFLGEVVEIRTAAGTPCDKVEGCTDPIAPGAPIDRPYAPEALVIFATEATWKGVEDGATEFALSTRASGAACGYPFELGRSYLVYAQDNQNAGALSANLCTRTRPAEDAGFDLGVLGR